LRVSVRLHLRMSPAGTAEFSPGRSPGFDSETRSSPAGTAGITIRILLPKFQHSRNGVFHISSRPCGTFRTRRLNPGLRPGLSSTVPTGLSRFSSPCVGRVFFTLATRINVAPPRAGSRSFLPRTTQVLPARGRPHAPALPGWQPRQATRFRVPPAGPKSTAGSRHGRWRSG
jgi:hypothetical protein